MFVSAVSVETHTLENNLSTAPIDESGIDTRHVRRLCLTDWYRIARGFGPSHRSLPQLSFVAPLLLTVSSTILARLAFPHLRVQILRHLLERLCPVRLSDDLYWHAVRQARLPRPALPAEVQPVQVRAVLPGRISGR